MPIKTSPIKWGTAEVDGKTYLTLDGKNYELLSRNMAEFLRWVREAKARLDWYKRELLRDRGETGRDAVTPKS